MANTDTQSDLLVIGGGSAGLALAIRAARHGAKVTVFEPHELGGTCVNRGCVPKKAMWLAAELARLQKLAVEIGFDGKPGALDWPAFIARRQAYVERARHGYARRLEEYGIRLVAAYAHFADAHALLADGVRYGAPHIAIATGSRPRQLDLPGVALGIDSDGFFELRECPPRVGIIGGGYIAVELAGVLHALGAKVELFSRSRLLSHFDAELGGALGEAMAEDGVEQHDRCAVGGAVRERGELWLDCADHARHGPYDQIVWAVGRVPDVESLQLQAAGVALGEGGHVATDEFENTSVEGVYALGDVNGKRALTPVAIAAGRALAERLFGGQSDSHLDYMNIPSVVFSHPPVASVGLSETQARAHYGDAVHVHMASFVPMLHMLAGRDRQRTLMKMVTVGDEERIVGLHGIGPGMDEMLQGFAVALRMGATRTDFLRTVAIHPTSAEEFVLMP
ncbi:MAG TPA: glutathione-disulfide reductase [Rhodanobacteraceae bacterium]|nr:glutathione-disulfide reductase [Rhodanobacteraceae bacterium]